MLKTEKNYDFQSVLTKRHNAGIRKKTAAMPDEILIPNRVSIVNRTGSSQVVETALFDLKEFFSVSMNIDASFKDEGAFCIVFDITDAPIAGAYEYQIDVSQKGISITGSSDRAIAQAVYYIEFCMEERCAPLLKKGKEKRGMPFSPRMVHSGYALDDYPDDYLLNIARYGYDAIVIFVKGVNQTPCGYVDFNDLTRRAAKYGIDVYGYCYLSNFTHPDDEGAAEIFDDTYGKIFKECNALKGMVFVGESVEFASRDKNTTGRRFNESSPDNIPENKPSPGWWPCEDYVKWISLVKNSIRKYKSDADIVFWTYNWGWAPEKDRLALIERLPTDISLQVTFEMFQKYELCGAGEAVSDYSLARSGAGEYFLSEAKAAKKKGIRLYSMVNTAGGTWDIGTVPYLPMAQQWIERFKAINEAGEKYGLCGLMEGHHYGFYPNFIARLATLCYQDSNYEKNLDRVLQREFGKDSAALKEGLKAFSRAIQYLPPTIEEQYGPLRVGTAYPLCLIKAIQPKDDPAAHFGNLIWSPLYGQFENGLTLGFGDNGAPYGLRHKGEMQAIKKAIALMKSGIVLLRRGGVKNAELLKLINLGEYITCVFETVLNVKEFYEQKVALRLCGTREKMQKIVQKIEEIALKEIENSKKSIEFLEKDSRLGFEPTMLYCGDKNAVLWKIKQVNYMLDSELKYYT